MACLRRRSLRASDPPQFDLGASGIFEHVGRVGKTLEGPGGVNGAENSPAQDSYNLRAERGLAYFDTRQRLVNTVVYQLPFGRDKRYLRYGLISKVIGGWETSGILTVQTGFPFTPNLRGDTAGVGAGTGGIFIRLPTFRRPLVLFLRGLAAVGKLELFPGVILH